MDLPRPDLDRTWVDRLGIARPPHDNSSSRRGGAAGDTTFRNVATGMPVVFGFKQLDGDVLALTACACFACANSY